MSWSVGVTSTERDNVFTALGERFSTNYAEAADTVVAQFEAAKDAVSEMLEAVEGNMFNISLVGHSQAADPQSAKDALSISITAV